MRVGTKVKIKKYCIIRIPPNEIKYLIIIILIYKYKYLLRDEDFYVHLKYNDGLKIKGKLIKFMELLELY